MARNDASNAVLAKARALYGRRLQADDYKTLIACRSMPELAGALKTFPLYAPELREINPVFARRALLENALRKSIFSRYASLCQYDMSAGQEVWRYFILCCDLDEIITCLRYMDNGAAGDYLFVLPDFLQKHSQLNLYQLARAKDADSLLRALAGSPYAAPLSGLKTANPAHGLLAAAEPMLTEMRHKALVALAPAGHSNAGQAPGVREYVQLECDIEAISNAGRAKRMNMPQAAARRLALHDCTALSPAEWEALLSAPTLAEYKAVLAKTTYGPKLAQYHYNVLKEGMHRVQYQWCLKWLRFSTDPTLVMLCYTCLAKNEVTNLNHIIEGVHYGLGADAILPLLVGFDEQAA